MLNPSKEKIVKSCLFLHVALAFECVFRVTLAFALNSYCVGVRELVLYGLISRVPKESKNVISYDIFSQVMMKSGEKENGKR